MIGFLRRRRVPVRPETVTHTGVVVVDGTGYGVGGSLCAALAGHAVPALEIDPFEVDAGADVVVLLLPLPAKVLPPASTTALSKLDRISGDPQAARWFRSRLIVAWYLRQSKRTALSAPTVGETRQRWNSAELLLATSWRRELVRHTGDERTAVRCRSDRVERMLGAPTHHRLGINRIPNLSRTLRLLDPWLLHGLCVEVGEHDGRTTTHRWTGAASVAAAVRYAP
ncbi:hypothetical protein ABZ816_34145 [Actinosynnema sp. NPDC047251]|uniref:hypothetical protein n=1 Tax=Saccharothrix espanaensis TaxID=103731 RepID=UPI000303794B|nr:hypothetical protein [Saccharothrix espanaensis]